MCEGVVVFVVDALVVVADCLIELVGYVLGEGQREVGVRILRVQRDALLLLLDRVFVVLQLSLSVRQIAHYRLDNPARGTVTESQGRRLHVPGFLLVSLLVLNHPQFIVYHRVTRIDFPSLLERQGGRIEVIGAQLLHPHLEVG